MTRRPLSPSPSLLVAAALTAALLPGRSTGIGDRRP